MLSMKQLDRNWRAKAYDTLTRDLALNGLPVPLSLRVRLSNHNDAPTGLALRRAAELIYGSTALTRDMVEQLLEDQRPDGSWGWSGSSASSGSCDGGDQSNRGGNDALATACVLAGLEALDPDHDLGRPAEHTRRTIAIERGYAALANGQADDGLLSSPDDRSFADRLLATAFVQYLLHRSPRFRGSIRWFELCDALESAESRGDRSLDRDGRSLLSMSNRLAGCAQSPATVNSADTTPYSLGSAA